jgi:exopolyphosphatase/guanosine-5'-triphosphate,3'-diphosphate pyrophosphatase
LIKKIAVIDIGTYSTRLLIAGIYTDTPLEETIKNIKTIFSVGKITSLGRNLNKNGYLEKEAVLETLKVLEEYVHISKEYKVEKIIAYATQACRIAKNGKEFLEKVKNLGIDVRLISGDEEAYLSFLATAYSINPDKSFVVIDQGGGSTEYAFGKKEKNKYKLINSISFPFGIVNLTERFIHSDPPKESELEEMTQFLREQIIKAKDVMPAEILIGLGGTITTIVALEYNIYPYDSSKVHGKRLTYKSIVKWLKKLSNLTIQQRKKIPMIEDKRAEAIISGIVIFKTTLEIFNKQNLVVSDRGLRHGAVIYEILNNKI